MAVVPVFLWRTRLTIAPPSVLILVTSTSRFDWVAKAAGIWKKKERKERIYGKKEERKGSLRMKVRLKYECGWKKVGRRR